MTSTAAAIERPLLIVLDDVQWADPSTLDAVRVLSGRLARAPIVRLAAFRPRHDSAALARTADLEDAKAIKLVLEPLDVDAVASLVAEVFNADPDPALLELVASGEGVPFYLLELLRGWHTRIS